MNSGKIIGHARNGKAGIFGDFHIEFSSKTFGPYNYIFTQENLYFCEDIWDRGASLFPLKEQSFKNTEIFLERDDIVVCCGVRGSFSGQEKLFVEFVNLKTANKYRFFPEEVSLIYHTQEKLICCYKDGNIWKKSEFSLSDFSLISESQEHISAFFKLFYHHNTKEFTRIIYKDEAYFFEMLIPKMSLLWYIPQEFNGTNFKLQCIEIPSGRDVFLDVWEISLTWEF